MTTLAICRPQPDANMTTFTEHLAAEGQALRQLKEQGFLLQAYSPGRPGAVLILDTDTDTAGRLLADLPLVGAGLLDIELIPLTPLTL